jgi:hypothetical protein
MIATVTASKLAMNVDDVKHGVTRHCQNAGPADGTEDTAFMNDIVEHL